MSPDSLVTSVIAATRAAPSDVPLRLHLVDLLRERGERTEAIRHCAAALAVEPLDENARAAMIVLLQGERAPSPEPETAQPSAEKEQTAVVSAPEPQTVAAQAPDDPWDAQRVSVTLADVGGMATAKERLEAAVLAPMRNPELRRLYRQSRSGSVLLYGPPGCGKTFLARATAGELDARFLLLDISRIAPESIAAEITEAFEAARAQAPVVLCLDEVDALAEPGSERRGPSSPGAAALAAELDRGAVGVTVIAASSAPWDLDAVLRRPGRLETDLLVLPPDRTTREVVLRQHLGEHPDVDVTEVAAAASGYSGADLAQAVRAAEARGDRMSTSGLIDALATVEPSATRWLETATRRLATHADPGAFVGLREYVRGR